MPASYLSTPGSEFKEKEVEEICLFAQTNFRGQMRRFGIKLDDRRRHMYIIGKTGMGKSTMMENMMLHDIYSGHGVGLVDPHGDFAEKIIDFIPSHRINDVVYVNPSDLNFPIGFNILEVQNEEQKHLVAAGMMATFKKIWPDVWSARMEYILNNTLLALLEYPGSTLLGINRLLSDKAYRKKVIRKVKDPVIKAFWESEFASYTEKYAQEAVAPIQNKIGQFLSTSVIRNMVAQVKSTIDMRRLMDEKKIVIMNLSKGRIGEDNSRLLGGMLITKIQLSAMERVDTPEKDRKDFFLYVDEFQNFATPSFANILSEARKYRLSLIMAHQYVKQLDEIVADAVFGNVGTLVTFRIGAADAEMLAKEFTPTFLEEDIVNLTKFRVLLKLMIDGVASLPFSALTMPPIASRTDSTEKVVRVSRERYAKRREDIEEKISRWSGIGGGGEEGDDDEDDTDENIPLVHLEEQKTETKPVSPPVTKEVDAKVEEKREEKKKVLSESHENIVTPPTVSLGALPSREEVKREPKREEKPPQIEKKEVLFPPVLDTKVQEVKEIKEEKEIQQVKEERRTSEGNVSLNQGENNGEKKKRKRKRNRKKKKNGSGDGGGVSSTREEPPKRNEHEEKRNQEVRVERKEERTPPNSVREVSEPVKSPAPMPPPTVPPAPKVLFEGGQTLPPSNVIRFDD